MPRLELRDATREYAYGPTQELPDTKVGTFTKALTTKQPSGAGLSSACKTTGARIRF